MTVAAVVLLNSAPSADLRTWLRFQRLAQGWNIAEIERQLHKAPGPVTPEEAPAPRLARQRITAWSLISSLELAALPTAAGSARKHARAVALEFGLSEFADTIELIVSEVVTNAVLATRDLRPNGFASSVVRLSLESGMGGILIRVWDASTEMPARRHAGPADDSGRGLMLMDCLASEWGAYRVGNGKVVWVIVR